MSELVPANVKSITVIKRIIRADGTQEDAQIAAYVDRDVEQMESVLAGEVLPPTVGPADGILAPHRVEGICSSGHVVVDMLNDVSPETAQRIIDINERQRELRKGE